MKRLLLLCIPLYACSAAAPIATPAPPDARAADDGTSANDGPSEVNTWDVGVREADGHDPRCPGADLQCEGGLCYGWQCCTGCFDGVACQPGTVSDACGAGGQDCNACDVGKACVSGVCN